MDLSKVFGEVSAQMRSDFAEAQESLTHPGLKGEANEEVVKKFFRQYFPRTLDTSQGILVDSDGKHSRQLDIIISDSSKTPIFFQSGSTRVIPIECAYAVIEVKAYLDKTELGNSYQNMKSVKTLTKKAFFERRGAIRERITLYRTEWSHWPINHFIFAYDSEGLDSVLDNLDHLQVSDPVDKRIDMICVLAKGVILNKLTNGTFSALPEPGSLTVANHTEKSLLLFYALMSLILNQAHMEYFNLKPYLGNMKF